MDTDYLTPLEDAQRLRVRATTVRQWIAAGMLDAEPIKQGKRTRYRIKVATVEMIERRSRHHALV